MPELLGHEFQLLLAFRSYDESEPSHAVEAADSRDIRW